MGRRPPPKLKKSPPARPEPRGPVAPRPKPPDERRMPAAATAREAAARAVARQAFRWPDLEPDEPRTEALDERDAALAFAIYDATMSRWLTLEYLLDRVLERPLATAPPALQAVLLTGAAQVIVLDRIPAHAAIDQAVELAKNFAKAGPGLVNAVLRKVAGMRGEVLERAPSGPDDPPPSDAAPLSGGRWVRLVGVALPADPLDRLAVATSHPAALVRQWFDRLGGLGPASRLALHSLADPPIILNTTHARGALPEGLAPHAEAGHHVFTGTRAELSALLGSRSDLWAQDPSSSAAIAEARHLRPSLIVDACAGLGTKTKQLALTFPNAKIVATDPDARRFKTLRETFAGSAQVEAVETGALMPGLAGKADLVLLDVPCSNTGVLARRVEAKYRVGREQTERLTGLQRQIVADALPLLTRSPRGRILYATCSIDEAENRGIADWAGTWHRLRPEHEVHREPRGLPGESASGYRDGSYSALLA